MLSAYPACFFQEENGYSVIFPDLNSATCGDTLNDALSMAVELLAGLVYSAKIDKEELPKPSSINSVHLDEIAKELDEDSFDPDGSFVNIVTVDAEEYAKLHFTKSVKKNAYDSCMDE